MRAVLAHALAHYRAGNAAQALAVLEASIADGSANLHVLEVYAQLNAERGDHRAAVDALRRAASMFGDNAPDVVRIVRGLLALEAPDDAIELLQRAAAANPDDATLRNDLGAILLRVGRSREAVEQFQSALDIEPDYATAASNLAMAYNRLGHLSAARDAARRALDADATSIHARVELAAAGMALGDYADAERTLQEALVKNPEHAGATIALAELHELTGRYRDALERIDALPAAARDGADARLVGASVARRLGDRDEALRRLAPLVDDNGLPRASFADPQRRRLGFLLGDVYDGLADFERAVAAYDCGNRAAGAHFEPARFSARVDDLVERYGETVRPDSTVTAHEPTPVFIVGLPRSGTSLLETMLGRHPAIHAGGELAVVGRHATDDRAHGDMPATVESSAAAAAVRDWFEASGAPPGMAAVTDKMPLNFLHVGWIARIFPGARIVHLRRDPADLLLSCYRHNFLDPRLAFTFDLDWLCAYWCDYDRLMAHWRRVADAVMIDVEYEALVREPEMTLRRLCDFVGVDFSALCLHPELAARNVATASHAQVREPINERSIGRFERYAPYLGARALALAALR